MDTLFEELVKKTNNIAGLSREWFERRLTARWFPRVLPLAALHIKEKLQGSPCFLYGAGTHTMALISHWREHGMDIQVEAIIDSNPGHGKDLDGIPIVAIDQALASSLPIVLSHHEFEDAMRDTLRNHGIPRDRILPVYLDEQYGAHALEQLLPRLLTRVQTLSAQGDRARIVLVNVRKRRILDKGFVAHLQEIGKFQFITISLERSPEPDEEGSTFNTCFNACGSLAVGLKLLERLAPDLVVVQEHYSSGNFLPMTVALAMPGTPVVGEFYDFLGLTFDDPMILARESYWRPKDVALAMAAENWCLHNLAGIITKESGPVLEQYVDNSRTLQVRPFLPRTAYRTKESDRPAIPPRLVWAGAINTSTLSPRMYGDNQLIDVFTKLVSLGFEVCAQTSITDQATLTANYGDYLELERRCANFSIRTAIDREELLDHLARHFDFGLMLGIPKPDTMQNVSSSVTVSGKMFTYLAAGLPVIVGSYLRVMADWVERYGLGIVVDHCHIHTLPAVIARCDYERLLKNVAEYRREHCLEKMLPALHTFFMAATKVGKHT